MLGIQVISGGTHKEVMLLESGRFQQSLYSFSSCGGKSLTIALPGVGWDQHEHPTGTVYLVPLGHQMTVQLPCWAKTLTVLDQVKSSDRSCLLAPSTAFHSPLPKTYM